MTAKRLLITGSCGLIGSEVAQYFHRRGFRIAGIDNNQRAVFFGLEGDTSWALDRARASIPGYEHYALDIRDRAAAMPFDDFDTNATGTLNLLEAARRSCPESPFLHMSTNKVHGDLPNRSPLRELDTRWDYDDPLYEHGIPETLSIDQSKHSLFGASKLAADVMVQEYGRYFNMPTCCLRGGASPAPIIPAWSCTAFLSYLSSATWKAASTKFSATRASRCAITFTPKTSRS